MSNRFFQLESELRRRGTSTAAELAAALSVSQPTLSRALSAFPPGRIHRIGRGRATRYALHRSVEGLGPVWPLYRIDEDAAAHRAASLHALEGGAWHVEVHEAWPSLRAPLFDGGLYPDWPWFLDDLRPQGFLGRVFAGRFGAELGAPADPRHWSADHILRALLRHGHDLPGAFVIGEKRLEVALQPDPDYIPPEERPQAYARRAAAVLEGRWPGSSAAGEQPKFTATLLGDQGKPHPVLVKFTGDVRDPAQARRADLLVAEHLVNSTLIEAGIPAALTDVFFHGGRCFLQTLRFDRTPSGGRRPLVSLFALNAAFGDINRPWRHSARALEAEGLLAPESAERLRLLWAFGRLIGNSDMHDGNIALRLEPAFPLSLAPVYDMSPMALAPRSDGSLPNQTPPVPLPLPEEADATSRAETLARRFRERVHSDSRLTHEFRRCFT